IQSLEHYRTLGPKAGLGDFVPAVSGSARPVGLGVETSEILVSNQAAIVFRKCGDPMSERTFVEIIANGAELGLTVTRGFCLHRHERAQSAGEGGLAEDVGAIWRGTAGEKEIARGRPEFKEALVAPNKGGELLRNGKAGGGVLDGGSGHLGERQGPVTQESEYQAVEHARHRRRQNANGGGGAGKGLLFPRAGLADLFKIPQCFWRGPCRCR